MPAVLTSVMCSALTTAQTVLYSGDHEYIDDLWLSSGVKKGAVSCVAVCLLTHATLVERSKLAQEASAKSIACLRYPVLLYMLLCAHNV